MIKQLYLSLILMLFPVMTFAYSGYVGDYIDLDVPSSTDSRHPDIYSASWSLTSGSTSCVTLTNNGIYGATVHIDSYFTGSVRVTCRYQLYKQGNLSAGTLNKTATFDITCNAVNLNVSPSSMSLKVGDKDYITYTTSPSGKWPTVSYSSSNSSVALVDAFGQVTAKSKGTATITLSNSMGPNATVSVGVESDPNPNPNPDPDPGTDPDPDPSITDGTWFQDKTEEGYLMLFCAYKHAYTGELVCMVSHSLQGISTITNANGKVTIPSYAKGVRVYQIGNAAFKDLPGLTELVIPSTVEWVNVYMTISCNNLKTVTCLATTPPNLSSQSDALFSKDPETLYVPQGCKAKYQSAKGWKKIKNIKEIGESDDILVNSITLSSSSATMEVGKTLQLTATIAPSNATNKEVEWSTSNSSVASVSSSGLVTAKAEGSATITCKAKDGSGVNATCSITVNTQAILVTSIKLNKTSATLDLENNKTVQLEATISPSNATNKGVSWSSSNSSVASVSSSGLVTAKAAGNATITCRAKDGSGITATCSVSVESGKVYPIGIGGVPNSISMKAKDTYLISWYYQYPSGTSDSQKVSPTVTWSSDNTSVATVSSGIVTAVKPGTATITIKSTNGLSESCSVTVIEELLKGNIKMVSAGYRHTMILKTDGTLWACGWNKFGQLGDGMTINVSTPKQVMSGVSAVSAGYYHTMILKADGTLWACGDNDSGQLGDGTATDTSTPKWVMSGVSAVAAGYFHTMILKTDGTLWACGTNSIGQLGDGTTTDTSTPKQVMSGVSAVSAGDFHTMILKADGTLWACGDNGYGQLGDGTKAHVITPKQMMSSVAAVSAGRHQTMILKTDGTLWACGNNSFGQLGDGTTNSIITPKQVMNGVAAVSAGRNQTMILKTDGTLWACGSNSFGQLGDGTTTGVHTPKQVMSGVSAVSAGDYHTMILKTDGTLWACGDNRYGQLGDGTNVERHTPVIIGEPGGNSSSVESLTIKREINTSIFTITGQRLIVPRKGINIIGGKKVIVR